MSVRKRTWKTGRGIEKEAWIVDYVDQGGKRRLKTFDRKKEADTFASTASVEVREGTHVADSASATVKEAGQLWLSSASAAGLERSTTDQYRQHLDLHISPFIGETLLSKMTAPKAREFRDTLRTDGRSPAMVRKVMVSLGSLLADAQERGLATRNAVRDLRRIKSKNRDHQVAERKRARVEAGADFPTRGEVRAIVESVSGRWRPLLITAIFTGLRASELRGLRWSDVDFAARAIHVRQRADRFNAIGDPKSKAGGRSVPMTPLVSNTLKEWKLACPKRDTGRKNDRCELIKELDLAFPNGHGKVESLANIINRGLIPAQIAAGVSLPTGRTDEQGAPIVRAKYTGMHTLRHWFASWCINRKEDGGLALPAKMVQERLGHASITITLDVYGHLFPRGDDADELAAAERALLA